MAEAAGRRVGLDVHQQIRYRPGPDQVNGGRHHQPVVDDAGRGERDEIRLEFVLDRARMDQLPEGRQVAGRQPKTMAARIPAGGGAGAAQGGVRCLGNGLRAVAVVAALARSAGFLDRHCSPPSHCYAPAQHIKTRRPGGRQSWGSP